ncbi:MAG: hypothetical protein NT005_11665 [Spirochaetes bacterium]|nr:hypothetical protein [Spirochaetota bacterium]
MRKRILFTLAISLLLAGAAFAQSFSVDYVDGTVELKIPKDKAGKEWRALSIGDMVAAEASIRVAAGSSIELSRGKARVTILKMGTYALTDLSRASEKTAGTGIGSTISQKLTALTTDKQRTSSAVGGVRGAEQGSSTGSVMWVEENEETRRRVTELLAEGEYREAAKVVAAAIPDASSDSEKEELSYMLAAAYYGSGETARAYRSLAKLAPPEDAEYYPKFLLLKAQILVDSLSFSDALALLKPFIASNPGGETAQVAYVLLSSSQKGLGDEKAGLSALNTGYAIDPSTETAKLISKLLGK